MHAGQPPHPPVQRPAPLRPAAGHLQNLDELAERHSGEALGESPTSPSSVLAAHADPRQRAAETILRMYQKQRSADILLLLSELQVGAGRAGGVGRRRAAGGSGSAARPCMQVGAAGGGLAWGGAPCTTCHCRSRSTCPCQPLYHGRLLFSLPLPPQGQYSFVLFDGEKRQVFAARDSSGSEPLYFELGEDGDVSLSNAQPAVPTGDGAYVQVRRGGRRSGGSGRGRAEASLGQSWAAEGLLLELATVPALLPAPANPANPAPALPPRLHLPAPQWSELPPGHFISGRAPKVQQFALTPQQLSIRETYEREMDEDLSPRWGLGGEAVGVAGMRRKAGMFDLGRERRQAGSGRGLGRSGDRAAGLPEPSLTLAWA